MSPELALESCGSEIVDGESIDGVQVVDIVESVAGGSFATFGSDLRSARTEDKVEAGKDGGEIMAAAGRKGAMS